MKTQISMTQNEAYKEEIFAWVRDEDLSSAKLTSNSGQNSDGTIQ